MMSLFSSFDLIFFYWSYLTFFLVFLFILSFSYKSSSLNCLISLFSQEIMIKFFYSLKPKNFSKFVTLIIMSFLFCILLANFYSVFSYSFPISSQFGTVLSLGLTFWTSFMLFCLSKNFKGFILHFIPEGTPIFLTMFLFLIEIVSNIIRPITLTVRLVANILAGHLLMILLSNLVWSQSYMFLSYLVLNTVELLVGLIQAYIFSTMVILYFSEVH